MDSLSVASRTALRGDEEGMRIWGDLIEEVKNGVKKMGRANGCLEGVVVLY
jgi:hypothetical protein